MATNSRNKRNAVRAAAPRLFRKYGFNGTSMEMLADELDMSKGSIYHYYKTKNDLLYDVIVVPLERVSAKLAQVPSSAPLDERLREYIRSIVTNMTEFPNESAVYFYESPWLDQYLTPNQLADVRAHEKRFADAIIGVLKAGRRSGQFRHVDQDAVRFAIVGMVGFIGNWWHPGGRLSIEDLAEQYSSLVLAGITKKANSS